MKNLITIINLSIIIGITTIFTQSNKTAEQENAQTSDKAAITFQAKVGDVVKPEFRTLPRSAKKPSVDKTVVEFLQEMAEARMMDLEEGKTAQQRGTFRPLKDYGARMVKDQSKMLEELKKIAELKSVTLPPWLGPDKAEGLTDLRKVHGKSFDKKFIKMMIIDHKRDIKKLQKAVHYGDADIQVFATRYLPTVQAHLDQIKALKKNN